MARLILLLAIGGAIYLIWRRANTLPPHKRRAEYIKLGLGVTVVIVIALTLTGRMHWVGAAFTGLLVALRQSLPLLVRLFPMLSSFKGAAASAGGQQSTVQSSVLKMQLNHDSGELAGEVLKGSYQGWRLAEMDRAQLEELLAYCQSEDDDSVQLLDSYLQQRFPGEDPFGGSKPPGGTAGGQLSRTEALAVLGLGEDAADEDIVQAHRKLMQKLHPDRGGNDYLAAKINQAKDTLLG